MPQRQSARLHGARISDDRLSELIALGDEQARGNRTGGIGIPGGRKLSDVQQFTTLRWGKPMNAQLSSILQGSSLARDESDIDGKREIASKRNRRVQYQSDQRGEHSLHVANDIAAVWNSDKDKSHVYDYPTLTPKFQERFDGSDKRSSSTYFEPARRKADQLSSEERQSLVAQGIQRQLAGDNKGANALFKQSGATSRGQKWINKFSSLMLSERAREVHAGIEKPTDGLTHQALQEIVRGRATFGEKFDPKNKKVASFVVDGGAQTHRDQAEKVARKQK